MTEKGLTERIKDAPKVESGSESKWNVPHHQVFIPNKLGNIYRFLNGAAKLHGAIFDRSLLTGSDLLQKLIYVLLRFKKHPFAESADFEGMFQVVLLPCDQPSLRFSWTLNQMV